MLIVCALALLASSVVAQSETVRTASVNGRPVAYHVIGDGPQPPLVLINGGPGYDHKYFHWTSAWDRLAVDRKVVFFDQPGTGASYSVGPADTLTLHDLLLAIRGIQNELRAPQVALLGHSWGGYVAMAFATSCPSRTAHLILVGSAAPKLSDTEFNFAPLFPDSLSRGASPVGVPDRATIDRRRHLAMSFYDPAIRDRVLANLDMPAYPRQSQLLRADVARMDFGPQLANLRMPTLVGTGRFDANVAPRNAWKVHQAIPGSRFVVWERSGHYPMVEEPGAFTDAISAFLRTPRPALTEGCQLP